MLRAFRDKRLMIVTKRRLLTPASAGRIVAAGATIVGPGLSSREVLRVLKTGDVDAVIIDIAFEENALVHLAMKLEEAGLPFVFVSALQTTPPGYVLSDDLMELREIADALFGPPAPGVTFH